MGHPAIAYRRDVDGLRAVAVLPVLAYHAFPHWLPGGFVGVDIFFVISGYLISGIILRELEESRFGFTDFYLRRARRILPSLAAMLLAVLVAGWFVSLPAEYARTGKHAAAGAAFVSNFALLGESGYFDTSSETNPLLHVWSLAVEEQFYLVWPLLLFIAWRVPLLRRSIIPILLVASFAVNLTWVRNDQALAFYSPFSRLWELALGAWLAHASMVRGSVVAPGVPGDSQALVPAGMRNLLSICGATLVVCALMLIDRTRAFPGAWALLPTLGAACLIAAGPGALVNRLVLSRRVLVWTGLVSFQLYLWHWPLLVFERQVLAEASSPATRIAALALTFPLSWATFAFLDRPIRTGRRLALKALLACLATLLVGAAGYFVFVADGFPDRHAGLASELARFSFDYRSAYREGTCFLQPDQDASSFAAECDVRSPDSSLPRVVLWGDSHAAHLYPGLARSSAGRFDLSQYTASACPPLAGIEVEARPHCRAINDAVIARIRTRAPEWVILGAVWQSYKLDGLATTLNILREAGVQHVVVAGQAPHFPAKLPEILLGEATAHRDYRLPDRLAWAGYPDAMTVDRTVEAQVMPYGATFVSVTGILCSNGACRVHAGDGVNSLVAWDHAHLTTAGSEYVVQHFPPGALPAPLK